MVGWKDGERERRAGGGQGLSEGNRELLAVVEVVVTEAGRKRKGGEEARGCWEGWRYDGGW